MRSAALLWLCLAAASAEIRIERLFGPEVATGPYKHPASIATLDNGDLYLIYYGGASEYATETALYGSRRKAGAAQWTAPKLVAADPFRSLGNGVLWQAPDARVWLFYVVRFGATWGTSRIAVKVSGDRAETFSDASLLTLDEGRMVRNKPLITAKGEFLLPAYYEAGTDTEFLPPETHSLVYRYDAKTRLWKEGGAIRSKKGNLQPAIVEAEPGRLVAFCRRAGGYGPVKDGYIIRSESRDGGLTWSEGADTDLPNPNSAVELLKLKSGRLLLIYNHSMNDRTPLTAALSADGGRTWSVRRNLAEGRNSFAYPSAVQEADGTIRVVFTTDNRQVIRMATFTEQDLDAREKPR